METTRFFQGSGRPLIQFILSTAIFVASLGGLRPVSAEPVGHVDQLALTTTGSTSFGAQFPSTQEIDEAFGAYATEEEGRFNLREAAADGVDYQIIEIGRVYNLMLDQNSHCLDRKQFDTSPNEGATPYINWAGLGVTERWNWCGRDRTNGGEPRNSADRVCMNYDRCLGNPNANIWACDQAFVDGMRAIKENYRGADRIYIEAAIRAVPRFHGCRIA